jgi:hypothetical protein
MSPDDIDTERGHAAQAFELTGLPLVGMTMGTADAGWSARFWEPAGHVFSRLDCDSVRVVGDRLALTYNPDFRPAHSATASQIRSVSSWGPTIQADLARLGIGVVGAGSVGSSISSCWTSIG